MGPRKNEDRRHSANERGRVPLARMKGTPYPRPTWNFRLSSLIYFAALFPANSHGYLELPFGINSLLPKFFTGYRTRGRIFTFIFATCGIYYATVNSRSARLCRKHQLLKEFQWSCAENSDFFIRCCFGDGVLKGQKYFDQPKQCFAR